MIKNVLLKPFFLIALLCLVGNGVAQNPTIIRTANDYGMKCNGNADDTQRFMNAIGTGQGSQNLYIIFVNGTCNIQWVNPITVPSYVTFDFTQQGAIFLAAGSILNVNAAIVDQDFHPIFTGPGTYNIVPRNAVTCTSIAGGIACQATGAGGLPGNPSQTVQLNNSGTFGAIPNSNAGLLFSPNNSGPPAFQNVFNVTNPQANNDPNDRAFLRFNLTTDSTTSTPGAFNDENGLEIVQNVLNGQNLYSNAGGATRAKKTFLPFAVTGNFQGSGQKILSQTNVNCYSMGDCASNSTTISYAGGPITGDEGQGFNVVSSLEQQSHLTINAVSSTARTTCNTTTTQGLTPSVSAQTFTVASTTGCNVNDWVVLGQEVATGSPQESAMQITGVSAGHLTGVVVGNYTSGATVTPATVMNLNIADSTIGQDRLLVDTTTTPVTAGTVSSITGAAFTGSGTSWSNGMVGGNSTVIGCINLTPDDLTAPPFNGSVGSSTGPLHTFYPITAVSSATALSILSWSVAQDAAYHGNGPGAGGYAIRPCAKVLRVISSGQLILETNTFTWNSLDTLEEAINGYPDITGFQNNVGEYTAGGVRRAFMSLSNNGSRTFQIGINLTGGMTAGGGSDTIPFTTAFQSSGATTGLTVGTPTGIGTYAVQTTVQGTSHGLMGWQGNSTLASIGVNPATTGLELNTISFAPASVVQGTTSGSIVFGPTDPITGGLNASMPTGEYVGNWDVVQFNSATQPRIGIRGISSSWFLQPHDSGVTCFSMGVYNNKNGAGAEGTGVGEMARFNTCGQLLFPLGGGLVGVEAAAPSFNCAVSGNDCLWPDSTAHRWKMQNNNGSVTTVAGFSDNLGTFASGGTITPALYASNTNCSAVGTAANPSVASCSAASAGSFSCATNASTGTCIVNTTAVTANSQIFIQEDASLGTRLGVTCNTNSISPTNAPVSARSAGTSFTINLGTIAVNPECFSYFIIN